MTIRDRGEVASPWLYVSVSAGTIALAATVLLAMGRHPWCQCGVVTLWTSDTWGQENSQQLFDPYSFTHVTHGVLLYALLSVAASRWTSGARGVLAIAVESVWEIVENTNTVIERYRAATLALGYYGDSVLNSVGDILMCALGFMVAARCSRRATILLTVVLELGLLIWIRDNLALNIVMLLHPIEAVKQWQLGH